MRWILIFPIFFISTCTFLTQCTLIWMRTNALLILKFSIWERVAWVNRNTLNLLFRKAILIVLLRINKHWIIWLREITGKAKAIALTIIQIPLNSVSLLIECKIENQSTVSEWNLFRRNPLGFNFVIAKFAYLELIWKYFYDGSVVCLFINSSNLYLQLTVDLHIVLKSRENTSNFQFLEFIFQQLNALHHFILDILNG